MCVQLCVRYVYSRRHKHIDLTRWIKYVKCKWCMWCISKWHLWPSSISLVKTSKAQRQFYSFVEYFISKILSVELLMHSCISKIFVIWNGWKINIKFSPCLFSSFTQWNLKREYSKFIVCDCKMLPFWIPCNSNQWERLISNPVFLQHNVG